MSPRFLRSLSTALAAGLAISAVVAGAAQADIPDSMLSGLQWRLVGPFRGGWGTMAVGIPDQPGTFYFSAAGGGVWKTTNAGATWESMSDGITDAAIGAIAGGKKGAGVGAAAGGVGGLIYDLITRDKK